MKYIVYSLIKGTDNSWLGFPDIVSEVFYNFDECYKAHSELNENIIAGYGGDMEEARDDIPEWLVVGFRNNDSIPRSFIADLSKRSSYYLKWNDIIKLPTVTIINGEG